MKTITLLALLSISAFATDYSSMSVTQLQALRGSVPTTDFVAFQSAMQTKVLALSLTDRQALQSSSRLQNNLASCPTTGVGTVPVQQGYRQGYIGGGRIR